MVRTFEKESLYLKARVIKPKERLLYYKLEGEKANGVCKLAAELGIEAMEVTEESCREQVGRLAGWNGFSSEQQQLTENSGLPQNECLVFCGIDGAKMKVLLTQLRQRGLSVDLKAAVTQYNQSWRFCDLLGELIKEHKQMHGL